MKKALTFFIAFLLCVCFSFSVCAKTDTTQRTDGYADCIYVLGEHDNAPIEYYNDETEQFEGVMPDLLKIISQKTDIDFVYINGSDKNKDTLAHNLQAELVSCCNLDSNKDYAVSTAEVFEYSRDNSLNRVGFAFTKLAGEDFITNFNSALAEIPHSQIDGLMLKYSAHKQTNYGLLIPIGIAVALILAFLVVVLIIQNNKIRQKNRIEKMLDNETGIGNLTYFKYMFEDVLGDFERSIFYVAYIILDNSYLRVYYGDAVFSDVLKATAKTISSATAENEFAARITENGFALVFNSPNEADAKTRLEEIMKKLRQYIASEKDGNKLVFHAALYNLTTADKDSEILLFNLRKNCNKIFGTDTRIIVCDVHFMNRVAEEKKMTEGIIKAFDRKEFKLYLQFTVDAKTKNIVSAEALSRWDSIDKGLISPDKYIKIMEEDCLISKHDYYIFDLVCRQLEKWNGTKFSDLVISCNFTRITISEDDFISNIKSISDKYKFNKQNLCIEITEDAIEKNSEKALKNIEECKKLGFHIALDDLGSGYTSLINLCHYPVDIVKIDNSILNSADDERGRLLFEGLVDISHKLQLKVICEGVETPAQNEFVTAAGCDYIQGFYYYRPMPEEECEKMLFKN